MKLKLTEYEMERDQMQSEVDSAEAKLRSSTLIVDQIKIKMSFSSPEIEPAYAKPSHIRKLSDVHESAELNVDLTDSAERRVRQRLSRTVTSEDYIELEVASNGHRMTEGSPMKEETKDYYANTMTLRNMSEMG